MGDLAAAALDASHIKELYKLNMCQVRGGVWNLTTGDALETAKAIGDLREPTLWRRKALPSKLWRISFKFMNPNGLRYLVDHWERARNPEFHNLPYDIIDLNMSSSSGGDYH